MPKERNAKKMYGTNPALKKKLKEAMENIDDEDLEDEDYEEEEDFVEEEEDFDDEDSDDEDETDEDDSDDEFDEDESEDEEYEDEDEYEEVDDIDWETVDPDMIKDPMMKKLAIGMKKQMARAKKTSLKYEVDTSNLNDKAKGFVKKHILTDNMNSKELKNIVKGLEEIIAHTERSVKTVKKKAAPKFYSTKKEKKQKGNVVKKGTKDFGAMLAEKYKK